MSETKFSILIVDDEVNNLEVLNMILKSEYTVYMVKSGKTALDVAVKKKPDLILLDVVMPEMSGFETLLQLKQCAETWQIPVIFITGLTSTEDEEKGLFLGAVDYITKPFKNPIVLARVKTHLQIVKHMRTIEHLCNIDALTDIPNRRYFDERLATEWQKAIQDQTPISLLLMDVDNFKNYNDTYGHPQGDVLLQKLAKIFESEARQPGAFAARTGGEEFSVVLPHMALAGALSVAESIRSRVESTSVAVAASGLVSSVTISIGVASIVPTVDDNIDDLISASDQALYAAKDTGRNKVCTL